MILKFSCLTEPAVNTTESGNKCNIPVPDTHYTMERGHYLGRVKQLRVAVNESVTEFVVFFLGLYHTQCCTRQFCCGICRRLLPACRRETTCKGACLALARVVATTDVGRGRLWAPPPYGGTIRDPCVPWFAIGRDAHLRVFTSNCTPNVHLAIPKILRDIGLFLELL
jgi:hypothetical protein